ncbi:unnamed protein product [Oppiella nova]|uniref:N-myc downstream regulated n=1 Tax=Oppiella nova TaxID=334625 RepID=A0A7R9QNR5_9ACAR|nr:unnamed protein product [Oppiella nova]CAG2168648.1 unnamed protein product [Oppiella nova]
MAEKTTEKTTEKESQLLTVVEHELRVEERVVQTKAFGAVKVHIQGSLDAIQSKAVFLTVHDIGANHSSMKEFVDNESSLLTKHNNSARNCVLLPRLLRVEGFPTIQQIGEEVIRDVLDALSVPLVVGVGEGAGANILARFALAHPSRVLGLVLVHLVSAEVGFLDQLKDRFFHRRNSQQMSPLDVIGKDSTDETSRALLEAYRARVQTLNARNLQKYVTAYMNRKVISDLAEVDVLLVAGARSPYCAGVEAIHSKCNKTKTSLLKVDDVCDVMSAQTSLSRLFNRVSDENKQFPEPKDWSTGRQLPLIRASVGNANSALMPSISPAGQARDGNSALKTLGSIGRRRTLSMEEYKSFDWLLSESRLGFRFQRQRTQYRKQSSFAESKPEFNGNLLSSLSSFSSFVSSVWWSPILSSTLYYRRQRRMNGNPLSVRSIVSAKRRARVDPSLPPLHACVTPRMHCFAVESSSPTTRVARLSSGGPLRPSRTV